MMYPLKSASSLLVILLAFISTCRANYYWDDEDQHKVMSSGYFFKNGKYIYKVVLEKYDKRTWNEAAEICHKEENGRLLTLGDPNEARWVMQLISNLTKEMDYLGRFWIGATDKRLKGVYEYIDGSPFKFEQAPWAPGEPNRPAGKLVKYPYCIVMDTKDRDPKWSDKDCFMSYGYICKSDEAPRRLKAVQRFGYSWEWNYYDYKFVILPDDSMTWSEAEIYCQEAESGHLLSIYNSEEGQWITDRIRQIRQVLGFHELWIGATDIFSEGNFKWTDQKPVNYTKWNKPSNGTKKIRKPREACVTILADPFWGAWSEEYCIKKLPFVCKTKKCQGKSDLAFIVDASGSVTEAGFLKAKNFMFQVIRGFQVKRNETHVGLIGFSDDANLIFGFKKHFGNLQLKKAIDSMVFTKGETETHKALQLARTSLFSRESGSRDDVPKIALVLTDGKSRIPFKTSQAAKKLKEEGVTIVSLGIGNGVDRKELIAMASSSKDVLYVESYGALGAKVKDIRQRVCNEIIRVGLIQEGISNEKLRRQMEIDGKRRVKVEKELLDETKRKLAKKRQEEEAKKRQQEAAKRRQTQRNRFNQNRNRQNQRNRFNQNRNRQSQRNRQQLARRRQQELAKKRQQELAKKRQQELAKRRQQEAAKRRQQELAKKRQQELAKRRQQELAKKRQQELAKKRQQELAKRRQQELARRRQQELARRRQQQNRNRNTQNRNNQNRNTQNRNTQNRYNQNRNTQNRNNQNRNTQNRNSQNRNTQNRNNQNRNTQNRYNQNRNTQNRNTQNRYNQNRNTQNRNTQNRFNQNRNTQNRNTQNRFNQNRNTQNRNTQNRYNQNRNTQNRYNQNRNTQNRNTQNRYNQNRNTQNRYNQNRNTQNRNTQNRYNRNRNNQRNRYTG